MLTSRYVICLVGEGFSVEDKRTGKRVSYHISRAGAEKARMKIIKNYQNNRLTDKTS